MNDLSTQEAGLLALADRVEALSKVDFYDAETRKLNEAVLLAFGWRGGRDGDIIDPVGTVRVAVPPVLASLDSAMMLVSEGCKRNMSLNWTSDLEDRLCVIARIGWVRVKATAATPALALCAAALRARAAQ